MQPKSLQVFGNSTAFKANQNEAHLALLLSEETVIEKSVARSMITDHSGVHPSGRGMHFKPLQSPKYSFKIHRAKIDRTEREDKAIIIMGRVITSLP